MDQETSTIIQAFNCIITGQNFQQAQQWLLNSITNKGTCIKFLMIADNTQFQAPQRQLALTELSRAIKDYWNPKTGNCLVEDDKLALKGSILEAIIRCQDASLFKIYRQILHNLLVGQDWPTFADEVFLKLQNCKSMEELNGLLIAVQQLFNVHQVFTTDITQSVMYNLQVKGFPIISGFAGKLINNYCEGTANIIYLILKIYQHSINMELSDITASPSQIQSWLAFVKIIYDFQIPQIKSNQDSYLLKNRKLCGKIILSFISKHANKYYQKRTYNKHVPELFEQKYAVPFLESFMQTIYTQQKSSTDLYYACKYIQHSLKFPKTFQVLFQHFDKLLFDICIPMLSYTQEDQQMFTNDPLEYIRREEDVNSYKNNIRNTASELIEKIVMQKDINQKNLIFKVQTYIYEALSKKINPKTNNILQNNEIDGFLLCIGRLKTEMLSHDELKNQVERMLFLVAQEFQNPDPIIQARICWIFTQYQRFEYENDNLVQLAVQGISICIQNKQYQPVQVMAAIALDSLLEQKIAREFLKPNLQVILSIYLDMINKIEYTELIDALDGIIEVFQEDMDPYAQVLIQSLINSFNQFAQNSEKNSNSQKTNKYNDEADDEDEENVIDGAKNCLKAITKVLDAPLLKSTVLQLEYLIMPLLDNIFIQDSIQYIDDISNILNLLLYKSQEVISEQLWFYFPIIVYNITGLPESLQNQVNQLNLSQSQLTIIRNIKSGLGNEYIEFFLSPLKNYLSRGNQQFQQKKDFFGFNLTDLFLQMISKIYSESSEVEKTQVSLLYISFLENNRGCIDGYLPIIIQNALKNLNQAKEQNIKNLILLNLEIIAICLWNNPVLSIQLLESQNFTTQFFSDLIVNAANFKADFEKQRVLYGLQSLLSLQNNIPVSLCQGLNIIVKWMVQLTQEIIELREQEFAEKQKEDYSDISDISEEDNQEDLKYRNTLKAFQQCTSQDDDGEDDDEDFSPDRDIEANSFIYMYDSVLDKLDEVLQFEDILKYFSINNVQFYQLVMGYLNENEINQLQINFKKARLQDYDKQNNILNKVNY